MPDSLLHVRGLIKHFPVRVGLLAREWVRAVDGLDLDLRPGETLGVVGESGCGKSTLARLLVGLLTPTAGKVTFLGKDVPGATAAQRREIRCGIQIVFQDPYGSLNPRMSIGEIVERPLIVHQRGSVRQRRERIADLFHAVGLPLEFASRFPHELSGGQRQRVAIARAIAPNPQLLVADEPTSALDVSVQAKILNLLKALQQAHHLTLVFISHDMRVVRHMSDRIAVMYLGKIVELASKEEVFARPRHPYTRALLASVPGLHPDRRQLRVAVEGDPPSPLRPPPGCRFHPRCPFAQEVCRQAEPALRRLAPQHYAACHLAEEIEMSEIAGGEPGVR